MWCFADRRKGWCGICDNSDVWRAASVNNRRDWRPYLHMG